MNVIFVSSACSKKLYTKIFELRNRKIIDPAQKFLEQIMTGVAQNNDVSVFSISERPVSASSCNVREFGRDSESENSVNYIYPAFHNGKILRYLTCYNNTQKEITSLLNKLDRKNTVVICDPLVLEMSRAARSVAQKKGFKCLAITTDIPYMATDMKSHGYSSIRKRLQSIYEKLSTSETEKYDGYILLSSYMNELVNKKRKPYTVIEGSIDKEQIPSKTASKNGKKVVLYAGGLYEKYGLKHLVDAFRACSNTDSELHLYGDGSYVPELQKVCAFDHRIKYMGCVLNTELTRIESGAALLVNPRFSTEEYTKYSFPSKTLEYMTSGTAVLTTRLKGIPIDYHEHLFFFDGESVDEMRRKLEEVLSLDISELDRKGEMAQKFVISQKNNIVQGNKLIELASEVVNGDTKKK